MTPELKSKWLNALRSEKYKQGQGQLRNLRNEFCCLGVLCDIAGYEWTNLIKEDESTDFECAAGLSYIENSEEMEKLGLSPKIHTIAYCLNDGTLDGLDGEIYDKLPHTSSFSFSEIADWLEKNL